MGSVARTYRKMVPLWGEIRQINMDRIPRGNSQYNKVDNMDKLDNNLGSCPDSRLCITPIICRANQRAANSSLASQQSQLQTQNAPGRLERTDVRISAPEIDWNYAVIERLDRDTLKTSLIPFDLGKLVMLHDRTQDLELQAWRRGVCFLAGRYPCSSCGADKICPS